MQQQEDNWISFSDIMTGLMVIFMFIAIAYILQIQHKQAERDEIFEEFKATKEALYLELDSTFRDDFKVWDVILDKDLSIKFVNQEVLFASGQSNITQEFKKMLDEFFPKYLEIIMQPKYKDKIAEVRIEGHTDTTNTYMYNVQLSQDRARSVLGYLRDLGCYKNLSEKDKNQLQFWVTANGLSYGRTLDNNRELTIFSNNPINKELSRRVEFRIVTNSEKLVEKVIENL
jgi:outer membrane protein OmpA-like peptidoglycan-associated protein